MFHLLVAAALDDVQEAGDVAVDIEERVVDRIAHPRLRRKMDHAVEFLGGKQRFDAAAIGQVQLFEAEIPLPLQYLEPRAP